MSMNCSKRRPLQRKSEGVSIDSQEKPGSKFTHGPEYNERTYHPISFARRTVTMPASEARIQANRQNALSSTGPKTLEGKAISRGNALKHGLTGAGVALSTEDAAEVQNRFTALQSEMKPSTELGWFLIQRVALLSVRMDRSVLQETAALSERVRQAEADFVAPEGMGEYQADRLRAEAGKLALFDPSKEATLARRYEAAAERGLFRALNEFRQVEKEARAESAPPDSGAARKALGSFFPAGKSLEILDSLSVETPRQVPARTAQTPLPARTIPAPTSFEVPITIGRNR
jgi:hypothetical protein